LNAASPFELVVELERRHVEPKIERGLG